MQLVAPVRQRLAPQDGAGGADELSLTGANRVSHLHNGEVRTYDFDAQELGLSNAAIAELVGGTPEENAVITRGIGSSARTRASSKISMCCVLIAAENLRQACPRGRARPRCGR